MHAAPIALCSLAMASPAVAQPAAFDGAHVAFLGGYDSTDRAPGLGTQDGVLFGATGGYDIDLGGLIVGGAVEFAGSTASSDAGGLSTEADRFVTVTARAGVAVAEPVLLHARGGFANARIDGGASGSFDSSGFTVGGGGEWAASRRIFLRAEYRYSDYGDRLRGQQIVGGLGYRF